ncbi:MAG: UbiH/UbiF family hydroxylase [Rhodobacterales bacterium]
MERISTDILISGGGIAGMTAACAFGAAGLKVVCVDPAPPVTVSDADKTDLRSTAFLQPARNTLKSAGVWAHLEPYAAPLDIMRLADAGGATNEVRTVADFNASEISDEPFAWNLPNWLLRRELLTRIKELDTVTFLTGVETSRITPRTARAHVQLSNQSQVDCKLVLAADGRNSPTRERLGIGAKTWRFGQKAVVFCVSHQHPHENVSTEIHRDGGPFTLVPLNDRGGKHYSAVVWMEKGPEAAKLMALDEAAFTDAANARSCGILGDLKLESRRMIWPIISRLADRLYGPRTALIAEAAHVIPPIGAQGLNMSLTDIQCLLDLSIENPDNIGTPQILAAYEKARFSDIKMRVNGVNMLNRAAMTGSDTLKALRLKGLQTLHGIAPVRKSLMRKGLGSV